MAFNDVLQKYAEMAHAVSKDALNKAGEAVSKFGDESVLRIEKRQFLSQLNDEINALGLDAAKALIDDGKDKVLKTDEVIQAHLDKIVNLKKEIARRDELLQSSKN